MKLRKPKAFVVQSLRKLIQLCVVAFVVYGALGGFWRNYKVAHNNARLVGLIEGDTWASLYDHNEKLLALWGEPFEASLDFMGMPWASTLFGVPSVDPILALSQLLSGGGGVRLAFGALLPVGLAVVFGKVFCSHLCPMRLSFELGQLVRGGLLRLGVSLPHLRSDVRFGGWVLAGGLVAALLTGGAVWLYVLPYAGLSAAIYMAVTTGSVAGLLSVPVFWVVSDALLAPGFFCHNLCPQGFLLEQLGRLSVLRVVKSPGDCPTGCRSCEQSCPYALSPRTERHRPACDACGVCVAACPQDKLARKVRLPVLRAGAGPVLAATLALAVLTPATALAHHNKGLPHYGYYENYPQVPTEENVVVRGRWEMGATIFNFQGYAREDANTPNDVKFFVYLYDTEADQNYVGPVDFEILRNGEVVTRFTREKVDEETIYATRETLPETGDYELVAVVKDAPGGRVALPFHIELGDAEISSWLLAAIGVPVFLVFALALAGRTKRGMAKRKRSQAAAIASGGGAGLFALLWSGLARAADELPPCHAPGGTGSGSSMKHIATEGGGAVMVMGGIPPWLLAVAVGVVIVVSFVVIERVGIAGGGFRANLLKKKAVYDVVRSRWFQAVPQLLVLGVLGFAIYVGFAGSPTRNLTPVLVWTLWWGGLIFFVALLGPAFCFVCPWDALANLVSRLRVAARVDSLSLGFEVPGWLRNMWPAIGLFVVLTWLELGLGVTSDPRATATMGLAMAAMATIGILLFRHKAFCHYLCPVGRISGMYANFSPVELRARNLKVCAKCETEDCLNGNERGYPCPTRISLKVIQDSTYCTACTECVKSCDKRNVAINLRPFGASLTTLRQPKLDEAWMCIMLLTLTLFHGFSMTTTWENFEPGTASLLKWMAGTLGTPSMVNFSLGMAAACTVPVALFWGACKLGARWTQRSGVPARQLFRQYALALLPVALFYHLAHNAMHVLMEGGHVVPLVSDPLGRGADYFGTAGARVGHLLGEQPLWYLQVGLILVGHVFGVVTAHRISRRLYADKGQATLSLVPMTGVMVMLSVAGLTLMALDMNMRVGRM